MDCDASEIKTVGTSVSAPNGSSSSATAIPNQAGGVRARLVRVMVSGPCYVKFGTSSVAATTNDILMNANFPDRFYVGGCTHFAAYGSGAIASVNVCPIEF